MIFKKQGIRHLSIIIERWCLVYLFRAQAEAPLSRTLTRLCSKLESGLGARAPYHTRASAGIADRTTGRRLTAASCDHLIPSGLGGHFTADQLVGHRLSLHFIHHLLLVWQSANAPPILLICG